MWFRWISENLGHEHNASCQYHRRQNKQVRKRQLIELTGMESLQLQLEQYLE